MKGAVLWAGSVLIICLFGLLGLFLSARHSLMAQKQAELRNVASIAARFVDPEVHARFRDRSQESDSLYLAALTPLARILKADPSLKFIYTMIREGDSILFVLDPTPVGDADGDGMDDKSHILQHYPEASPACRRAFLTAAATNDDRPYTDAWGTFYSAYCPILRADGTLAAVLGVDMSAGDLVLSQRRLLDRAWLGIGSSLLLAAAVFAGSFLAIRKRRRDAEHAERILADLERARVLADAANAAKGEFLSVMSHEIRTPLNGVIGCASLLETRGLDPAQAELVRAIRESGGLLLDLVNDILDFSRIESKGVELASAPFDLEEEIASVAGLMGHKAREKGLAFDVEYPEGAPRRFLGDSTRIRQVLLNLVGNAIKFTETGGIRIAVATGPVRISIHDTGIGLSAEDAAKLFRPFSQAEPATSRRFGGTGLGLSICKRLVEAMGGEIGFESRPGAGSVFRFTLGLALAPVAEAAPAATDIGTGPQAFPGLAVLVVEDNQVNRMVIGKMLERLGCPCVFAEDGSEGAEMAAARRFDAILMDCQMPVMDGYTSARIIRAEGGASAASPIFALTANAASGEWEKCAASGMTGFLGKPIRLEDLRRALAEVAANA